MRSSSQGSGTSLAPVCGTGWSKPAPNMVLGAPLRLPCPCHLLLERQGAAGTLDAGSSTDFLRDWEDLRDGAAHLLGASKLQPLNGPSSHGSHPMLPRFSAWER